MVAALLAYQMQRQCASGEAKAQVRDLVPQLLAQAFEDKNRLPGVAPLPWLADFMMAAEFLAREQRHARPRASGASAKERKAA
jgi:CRISPR-associated protein Cmr2